jgi:hypothetical protein
MTTMPTPPSHCISARHNRMLWGMSSSPISTGRRGATRIDGELPICAQKATPKPQIAAARRLTGWAGPSEACLIRRIDA